MNSTYELSNKITTIETAYIYQQLYKAEFIKSKPITAANYSGGLRNKCMHVLKSKIKKIVEENPEYLTKVTFSMNNMTIVLKDSNLNQGINGTLLRNFVFLYYLNMNDRMKAFFNIPILLSYQKSILYKLNLSYPANSNNLKEDVDDFINALMFIPVSFKVIIDFITDYLTLNINRTYSLYDLYLYSHDAYGIRNLKLRPDINIENFKDIVIEGYSTLEEINSRYDLSSFVLNYLREHNMLLEEGTDED